MHQELMLAYCGFCGQAQFPVQALSHTTEQNIHAQDVPFQSTENWAIQYLRPSVHERFSPFPQPVAHAAVLLAGLFFSAEPFEQVVASLINALREERYAMLPAGEYCACLITEETLWFVKTRASNETIFYTRQNERLCWSTNPRQIVSAQHLDEEALVWCCTGKDTFVYTDIESVAAGTVVRIDATSARSTRFEQLTPTVLPRRVSLQDLAHRCFEALSEATRPLASAHHKIGVLLSGGIDSSAVAAALVHHGAHVVAYHLHAPGAADEMADAQAVCQRLTLPLVVIQASSGADYLSEQWRFSHPYNHAGLRWFEQVADQAVHDGVSLLTTGRGGDLSFGPLHSYGLYDIFSAPIAWQEKGAMTAGALSTDWLLPALIKSVGKSSSLIHERSLAPTTAHLRASATSAPFLTPRSLDSPSYCTNLYDIVSFSPQDLALEKAIWQPRGIHVTHPYHHSAVQRLATCLPVAYRLLPYRGKKVVKPVLRLAFAHHLPPRVMRQRRGPWLSVPHQEYCLQHTSYLTQLIGSANAQVIQRAIVDPRSLQHVLSDPQMIRTHYKALIATAMTELYLRQFNRQDGRHTGG